MSRSGSISGLTPAERKAFRRVLADMTAVGINADARSDLARDLVQQDARIAVLREGEAKAEAAHLLRASRALSIAIAERRRLHAACFAGRRKGQPVRPTLTAAERRARSDQVQADDFWREHWRRLGRISRDLGPVRDRQQREADQAAAELEAAVGEPSWDALMHGSDDEARRAWRLIALRTGRGNGAKTLDEESDNA